jgi:pyruvate formate lyase activating enzyme
MRIGGLQETSLIDYPDTICAIIWTMGCNFNCPFCYNPQLITEKTQLISEEEILSLLKKRKGKLEGVSITGGEPLLQKDLKNFLKKIKTLGYLIKIDTNGAYPPILEQLLKENLIDYIAMDIKAPPKKYEKLTATKINIKDIEKSIQIIQHSNKDYEFRTTYVPSYLKKTDIIQIAQWLQGSKKFYLQQYKNNTPHLSKELDTFKPYNKEYIIETYNKIKPYFDECYTRGI